jgi:hypothetical protein
MGGMIWPPFFPFGTDRAPHVTLLSQESEDAHCDLGHT